MVLKRSLRSTSSGISISGDELNLIRTQNINQALAGKVAGIQLRGQSGKVLLDSAPIRLGGMASLSPGSSPLYVIDGIIYDELPKTINPDDISDLSVLKDAAATAIYGARAVNGVVVITTKTKTFRKSFRDYAFWQPKFFH